MSMKKVKHRKAHKLCPLELLRNPLTFLRIISLFSVALEVLPTFILQILQFRIIYICYRGTGIMFPLYQFPFMWNQSFFSKMKLDNCIHLSFSGIEFQWAWFRIYSENGKIAL